MIFRIWWRGRTLRELLSKFTLKPLKNEGEMYFLDILEKGYVEELFREIKRIS
jgi:hypothetical protein